MNRRTFLNSAVGIGTWAGMYWEAKGASVSQQTLAVEEGQLAWGVNAVVLKSPWSSMPSIDDLLADTGHTVALDRFYRAGGDNRAAAPTECRIAYSQDALLVGFRCKENDMSFPVGTLKTDWYSLAGLPSGSDSWPPFPDEVDILIQPDVDRDAYYQFAAIPDGSKFGCERPLGSNARKPTDEGAAEPLHARKILAFEVSITKRPNEWLAFFQIPWKTLGGRAQSFFGFLPMRTRWRDGEFTTPVAIDFHESLPVDLLIETHFSGEATVQQSRASMCRLPSGIARWQRPALLRYPDLETLQQIWQMQKSLATRTDSHNLPARLYLIQRWLDLLEVEGFTFLPNNSSDVKEKLTPATLRQQVNTALRKKDPGQACRLLDAYAATLDAASRKWFADGSPGNVRKQEWKSVTRISRSEVKDGKVLLIKGMAGRHAVDLHLALPSTGGARVFTSEEGHLKPADLLPLKVSETRESCSVTTANGRIVINKNPFWMSFYSSSGEEVTKIAAGSLAFRFNPNGEVLAVDYKNQLFPEEVIYGFGEKYDHFDKRGTVLTLWGTDDWTGNGIGLRNTTYKPIPVFHSSKGYMVFNNSSYRLRADIGTADPQHYRLTQPGPIFDYYFWIDSPEKALQSYTALTGRPILPPKWAFGEWMGRGGQAWRSGPLHNAVAQEESVARRFAGMDIPQSAIYAEGRSAFSPALHRFMAARDIKVLGYFMPAIHLGRQESLMGGVKPDQLPIVHCGTESETRKLGYVDFANPKALELCRRWWRQGLDLGVAGSMVDYGDLVPEDAVFYNGKHGGEMHNFYYHDYHRTISEVFREKRGSDFILFARGAAPGTQKWVGQFAGDHPSNFDGLKAVLTGALNFCACGFSNWGSDLGGYFGVPEPAVYIRWMQLGLFSPLMRWHGKAPREPWHYGDLAVEVYKFCAWVRESLLDYIYNAAIVAHESGVPIIRSMALAFPEEPSLAAVRDQYMFGEDLLVAPVINEHNVRKITFPSGTWNSLWNGKTVAGPATLKVQAPLNMIPVYLREGAAMPVQLNQDLQFGQSMANSRTHALIATIPGRNKKVSCRDVMTESTTHGFRCILKNLPETSYLLLYGTTRATAVRVDGNILPKRSANQIDGALPGWRSDQTGNRLIICLPPTRKQVEVDTVA